MSFSMNATVRNASLCRIPLPQLLQLHNTLTRTNCTSEKEPIYTHGALRCLRGVAGLDLPSYQGRTGRHPPTTVISRTGHGTHVRRTYNPTGLRAAERRKPLPFSVTLVAAAAAAFTLMLSPRRKACEGRREGEGAWQLATELRPKRTKRIERGENETREKKRREGEEEPRTEMNEERDGTD